MAHLYFLNTGLLCITYNLDDNWFYSQDSWCLHTCIQMTSAYSWTERKIYIDIKKLFLCLDSVCIVNGSQQATVRWFVFPLSSMDELHSILKQHIFIHLPKCESKRCRSRDRFPVTARVQSSFEVSEMTKWVLPPAKRETFADNLIQLCFSGSCLTRKYDI